MRLGSVPFEIRSFVRQRLASSFTWDKAIGSDRVDVFTLPGPRKPVALEVPAAECAATFKIYQPGESYSRSRPDIFNLEQRRLDNLLARCDAGRVEAPACAIATFENASVLNPGVIVTEQGHAVRESLRNTSELREFPPFSRDGEGVLHVELPKRSRQPRLRGPHVLLRQECDSNYGHWLIECLPQAYLAIRELGLGVLKFIVSDHGPEMDRVYRQTLGLLGVRDDQIVAVGWHPVHVDELIFPLPLAVHEYVKSPVVIRMLEGLVDKVETRGAPKRVYVSRNVYSKRRLVNEQAILDICERHGFSVVYPETMSVEDQIRTFSAAEIVVGNCGAALTNIAFCPRGGTLIALANKVMPDGFFWDLADAKAFRYVSLHGRSTGCEPGIDMSGYDPKVADFFRQMDEDFEIDARQFEDLLTGALAQAPQPTRADVP